MKESIFQNKVISYLRDEGCYVMKYVAGPFTASGIPDLYGFLPDGRFFALELKTTSSMRKIQAIQIKKIRKKGGLAGCFTYSDAWKSQLASLLTCPETINDLPPYLKGGDDNGN